MSAIFGLDAKQEVTAAKVIRECFEFSFCMDFWVARCFLGVFSLRSRLVGEFGRYLYFRCQMSRVYIGNLGNNGSRRELEREFERFGPLRDVWVARNPPGFAFVVFEDSRDAEDACHEMDGRYVCGEKVRVEMARGPTRGGRSQRSGITEKCYECGRVGHYARQCTRRPGGGGGGRDFRDRRRRYSRSR